MVARPMRGQHARGSAFVLAAIVLASLLLTPGTAAASSPASIPRTTASPPLRATTPAPVANFSAAVNRLVELVGGAGAGLLALVWARVALSWFSNDIAKKVQAKDRARDALIGTLLFVAAVTGLVWGLAHWVVTGT